MSFLSLQSTMCVHDNPGRENMYLDKLVELEAALAQRKSNAEFNVPIIDIYGLEKQGDKPLLPSDNVMIPQDSSNDEESEIELVESVIDEDSDIQDLMEELDDSTESQRWDS